MTDHSLVVVVAPNCAQADSLATTFSVLGPEAAMRLRRALGRIELRMVRQPGHEVEITESPGFRRYYAP